MNRNAKKINRIPLAMCWMAALVVLCLNSCGWKAGNTAAGFQPSDSAAFASPAIEWAANPNFEPLELTKQTDVLLRITAPAGIASVKGKVESPVLERILRQITRNSSNVADLTGDSLVIRMVPALTGAIPVGVELAGKTGVEMDLTGLARSILWTEERDSSEHRFTLTVTDNAGDSVERTVRLISLKRNQVSVTDHLLGKDRQKPVPTD